jgi:hypothetical protein
VDYSQTFEAWKPNQTERNCETIAIPQTTEVEERKEWLEK